MNISDNEYFIDLLKKWKKKEVRARFNDLNIGINAIARLNNSNTHNLLLGPQPVEIPKKKILIVKFCLSTFKIAA